MPLVTDLLDNIALGIPANAGWDLIKAVWTKTHERSWEELYLDSFERALKQARPTLTKYSGAGADITLDREALSVVLHRDLAINPADLTVGVLSEQQLTDNLAEAMTERGVLIIGGHSLSQEDYLQIVRNLVVSAVGVFQQIVLTNQDAFRQASLGEAVETRRQVLSVLDYLKTQLGPVLGDKLDEISGGIHDINVKVSKILESAPAMPSVSATSQALGPHELSALIAGYALEVQKNFREYWLNSVDINDNSRITDRALQPVGQVFYSDRLRPQIRRKGKTSSHSAQLSRNVTKTADRAEHLPESGEDETGSFPMRSNEFSSLSSIFKALCDQLETNSAVLVAGPGWGKTLSLRHWAFKQAELAEALGQPIPIYLPLNAWKARESLEAFVQEYLRANPLLKFHQQLAEHLAQVTQTRPLLLLCDGLNELAEQLGTEVETFRLFLEQVRQLESKWSLFWVAASRDNQWEGDDDRPTVRLRPLTQVGIRETLGFYAPARADEIHRLLESNSGIRDLASTPFRLKALCQIYGRVTTLPASVGELLEMLVTVSAARESQRCIERGLPVPSSDAWISELSRLAYALLEENGTALWLMDLPRYQIADITLAFAEGAGIIQPRLQMIVFAHHQLQEYFAACWINRKIIDSGLESSVFTRTLTQPAWDETLLLLADIIATSQLLGSMIEAVASFDPFLAAKCVGRNPDNVPPENRRWLIERLVAALQLTEIVEDADVVQRIIYSLGDMRCEEALLALLALPRERFLESYEGAFCEAAAQFDMDLAADFIIERLRISMTNPQWRRENARHMNLLSRMRTPRATQFLIESLYDINLYDLAIQAVGEAGIREAAPRLQELLGVYTFVKRDEQEYLEPLAKTIGRLGLTHLLPDVMLHANRASALETILRWGAGQKIVDEYVASLRHRIQHAEWLADVTDFEGVDEWSFTHTLAPLDMWYWISYYVGPADADRYLDLLIHCATHSTLQHERTTAIWALAALRATKAIGPINTALQQGLAATESASPASADDRIATHLKRALQFLQDPRGAGISHRNLDRWAILMGRLWKSLDGKELPKADSDRLDMVYTDPEQLIRFAWLTLVHGRKHVDEYADQFLRPGSRWWRYIVEVLEDANWMPLAPKLVEGLIEMSEKWEGKAQDQQFRFEYERSDYATVWKVAEQIIRFGQRGNRQRLDIIQIVGPLIYRSNLTLRIAVIEILAGLEASEVCDVLLDFLSESNWQTAYAVVDALGRMAPPEAICQKLIVRLGSPIKGDRYFTALALGSIGHVDFVQGLLKLKVDESYEVRRAMIWALGNIGTVNDEIKETLREQLESPIGLVRVEALTAIGTMKILGLGREVASCLEDYDLRVVERAAWSLGEFRDRTFVPYLLEALHRAVQSPSDDWSDSYRLPYRPERRLPITILASLVRIRENIPVGYLAEVLPKELDTSTFIGSLVFGELGRGSWKAENSPPDTSATVAPRESVSAIETTLKLVDDQTLIQQAWQAPDPAVRIQVLRELRQRVDGGLHLDLPWHEPCPEVRAEICKIEFAHTESEIPSWMEHRLGLHPHYALQIAEDLSHDSPHIVNHLKVPDSFYAPIALWLAQLDPEAYDLGDLIFTLRKSLSYLLAESDEIGLALSELLTDRRDLSQLLLAYRAGAARSTSRVGLMYFRPPWPNQRDIWNSLAQRRLWGVVPALLMELNDNKSAVSAISALCELGIYQAREPIRRLLYETNDRKPEYSTVLAVFMAEVELSTHHSVSAPADLLQKVLGDFDSALTLRKFTNLLCEADGNVSPTAWAQITALRLSEGDSPDVNQVERAVKRWGAVAIEAVFLALGESDKTFTWLARGCLNHLDEAKKSNERSSYWFGQYKSSYIDTFLGDWTDDQLEPWLTNSSTSLCLGALAILARRKSVHIDLYWPQLLAREEPTVLFALLKCAEIGVWSTGRIAISRWLDSDASHALGAEHDDKIESILSTVERVLGRSLCDTKCIIRQELIGFVGRYQLTRLISALKYVLADSDQDLAAKAIEALLQMRKLEATYVIAKQLQSTNLDIVAAAITALGILKYRPKLDEIMDLVEHSNLRIRYAAIGACGLLHARRVVPKLIAHREELLHLPQDLPDNRSYEPTRAMSVLIPPIASEMEARSDIDQPEDKQESVELTSVTAQMSRSQIEFALQVTNGALFLLGVDRELMVTTEQRFRMGDGLFTFWCLAQSRQDSVGALGYSNDLGTMPYPLSVVVEIAPELVLDLMRRELRHVTWLDLPSCISLIAALNLQIAMEMFPDFDTDAGIVQSALDQLAAVLQISPDNPFDFAIAWTKVVDHVLRLSELRLQKMSFALVLPEGSIDLSVLTQRRLPPDAQLLSYAARAIALRLADVVSSSGDTTRLFDVHTIRALDRIVWELGWMSGDPITFLRQELEITEPQADLIRKRDRKIIEQCQEMSRLVVSSALLAGVGKDMLERLGRLLHEPNIVNSVPENWSKHLRFVEAALSSDSLAATEVSDQSKNNPIATVFESGQNP